MKILKIKKSQESYIVNGSIYVPKIDGNSDYEKIKKWIEDGGVVEPEFSLAEIKAKKIQEIKTIRDGKNIEPITDYSAKTFDNEGDLTDVNTFFVFHTNRHPTNPAADSTALLTNAIVLDQTVPYSSRDLSGDKVTVAITPDIARSLAAHLALRNNNNYKLADAIVNAINAATTEEEVNAITWSVDYL